MSRPGRPSPLFRKLPPGRSPGGPERAAQHRRARLMGAMIEALSERPYARVTIGELVGIAGISKRDFYESFASKEECFLATFEAIVERSAAQVRGAYDERGEDFRGRLLGALRAFGDLLVSEPAAARVATVDSLSLGTAAVSLRERAEAEFAELARRAFEAAPERGEVDEIALRGVIGGARAVVYGSLRSGRPGRFGEHAEELLDWALGYQRAHPRHVVEESFFAKLEPAELPPQIGRGGKEIPWWWEPPASALSRETLTVRERIVRAAGRVAAARGYASLTVPAISAAAGTSNQTFYREFKDKQEAFLEAFDSLVELALRRSAEQAFGAPREWPEAIGAVLFELLGFVGRNPFFARLAFFELTAAGAAGLDRAERAIERFTAFLSPPALPAGVGALPGVVVEAIGGGVWTVIQQEISRGRVESLPALAPALTDFVLVPFGLGPG